MQLKLLLAAGAAMAFAVGTAEACPDQMQNGERYTFSSDDLWSTKTLSVMAGGGVDLSKCSNVPGTGNVIERPDFTIRYNRTQQYNLRLRTSGNCDTVLLVNDANNRWHWDDDSGEGSGGQIMLQNASDGIIDVWVGTYGSENCSAQLELETFNN